MHLGDIVEYTDTTDPASSRPLGVVLNASVVFPTGETMPPMVEVLWSPGHIEVVYEDEIMILRDCS